MEQSICFLALGPKNIGKYFSSNFLSTEINLGVNVDSVEKEDQDFFWKRTTFLSLPSSLEAIWLESAGLQGRVEGLPGVLIFFK